SSVRHRQRPARCLTRLRRSLVVCSSQTVGTISLRREVPSGTGNARRVARHDFVALWSSVRVRLSAPFRFDEKFRPAQATRDALLDTTSSLFGRLFESDCRHHFASTRSSVRHRQRAARCSTRLRRSLVVCSSQTVGTIQKQSTVFACRSERPGSNVRQSKPPLFGSAKSTQYTGRVSTRSLNCALKPSAAISARRLSALARSWNSPSEIVFC